MQIPIGCGRVLKSVEWCVYGGGRFWRSTYAIRSGLILKPAGTQRIQKDDSKESSFFECAPSGAHYKRGCHMTAPFSIALKIQSGWSRRSVQAYFLLRYGHTAPDRSEGLRHAAEECYFPS